MAKSKQSDPQIVMRKVDTLVPYARNARTHTDAQVAQIAASIREFGWTNPILIDGESGVIAGHGRLAAARKLGLKSVPTIELGGLSDAQRRAYILADNRLALNAGWDEELLATDLSELSAQNVDLGMLGFDAKELERLLGAEAAPDDGLDEPTIREQWWVMVELDGEREQQKLLERLTEEGYKCKAQVA